MLDRRMFLAAASMAGARAAAATQLAVEGGKPIRSKPLSASYWGPEYYDEKERAQLMEVLQSGCPFRWYGPGDQTPMKVATFEREFAARMQTKYALAVTSGTAALQCAMEALGIGPGDEVIIPAWTWHSCANTVILAGGLPVFAEIDESFNLDPDDIERNITPQTRLILVAHLQGNPADLDRILPIARKHGLKVLEDCAQSVGASYKGKPVGARGDISIYSLQLNKTITAGEGGAVVTNDQMLFERAIRFHDTGAVRPGHVKLLGTPKTEPLIGTNFRMSEFTGGVLLAQLRKLDRIVGDVRANARRVYEGVRDMPGATMRRLPDPEGEIGTGIFFGFKSKALRDRYMAAMKAEGVPVSPPGGSVILPIVPQIEKKMTASPNWPSFTSERGKSIQYGAATCPRTIDILDRFAGVLIDPKFTKADCDDAVAAIRKVHPQIVRG